jgi:hypothetical protein
MELTLARTRLDHVLLASNPSPDLKGGWSAMSRRSYDVRTADFSEHDDWSLACNVDRVGAGTVGWIHRADGSFGHLAALIVFAGRTWTQKEHRSELTYSSGTLWRFPAEWWVDGARIAASGWSGRAPYGRHRRFRNGEKIEPSDVHVLRLLLHPVARTWLEATVTAVTEESA